MTTVWVLVSQMIENTFTVVKFLVTREQGLSLWRLGVVAMVLFVFFGFLWFSLSSKHKNKLDIQK